MPRRLTVAAKALRAEADQIERDARQSLPAWILLRQTDRFGVAMEQVRGLRRAAEIRSIAERREYLSTVPERF